LLKNKAKENIGIAAKDELRELHKIAARHLPIDGNDNLKNLLETKAQRRSLKLNIVPTDENEADKRKARVGDP
jgi:hypothetical protein